MSEPFIGEIRPFPYNFAPRDWAFCHGQLMEISQNTTIFCLIGTLYGGNGVTNFALPDLRGRVPIHQGRGPGLTGRRMGERGGWEVMTLTSNQIPSHHHMLQSSNTTANTQTAAGSMLANGDSKKTYATVAGTAASMDPNALGVNGSSSPHNNMQPYLVANFCIALQGLWPPRS
jgi:microcystin-dependent protein